MAEVKRDHRAAAARLLEDGGWKQGSPMDVWVNSGAIGLDEDGAPFVFDEEIALSQAIADAEARGYAACKADVVVKLRHAADKLTVAGGAIASIGCAVLLDAADEIEARGKVDP